MIAVQVEGYIRYVCHCWDLWRAPRHHVTLCVERASVLQSTPSDRAALGFPRNSATHRPMGPDSPTSRYHQNAFGDPVSSIGSLRGQFSVCMAWNQALLPQTQKWGGKTERERREGGGGASTAPPILVPSSPSLPSCFSSSSALNFSRLPGSRSLCGKHTQVSFRLNKAS